MNIGIIGYGAVASWAYLDALSRIPEAVVTAVAESDAARRAQAQNDLPAAHCCADYHDLLALPELEAVLISLPPALHAAAALAAMNRGKHVYLEKPLAVDLTEARAVVTKWRASGVTGMTGFNYRFHPLYRALRQQIKSGAAGRPVAMRTLFHAPAGPMPAWKQQRQSGGGVLLDLASHHIDLIQMLVDEPITAVTAQIQSLETEDDSAMAMFELAGGLFVQSSFALNSFETDRVEVIGTAGALLVDRHHALRVEKSTAKHLFRRGYALRRGISEGLVAGSYARAKMRAPRREPSYQAILQQFVQAAANNGQTAPTFEDGYRALAVVLAAEESARSGQRVLVDYEDFIA